MKILKEKTKFYDYVFDFPFNWDTIEYCRELKETLGYQAFNFSEKKWRFKNLEAIDMLKQKFTDIEIDKEIERDHVNYKLEKEATAMIVEKSEELKVATSSKLEIKGIKGELYDFQKIAVEFINNANGKIILASEMGTGKTIVTLAYIIYKKLNKILIITPASLKWNWYEEINRWTNLKAIVINSRSNLSVDVYSDYNVIIVNYDVLKKFYKILASLRFDVCVCDEAHYLKGRSQRFKATKLITKNISKLLLLSGTPLLNRSLDAYNLLNLIDPITWNNWWEYTKKYCNGHQDNWGYNANGNSNTKELKQKINKYFFRQTKAEVLSELPDKVFINLPIDLSPEIQATYNLVLNSFVEYLKRIKNKTTPEIRKTMQAEKLARLNELRQITSNGKIKAAEEIIKNVIENEQKILVFSIYNNPLNILKQKFLDSSVMIIGETKELERKKAVEDFQNNKNKKIFFGGMLSASVGLNLTAANNVLFIDFPWRPSDQSQAWSRVDRIKQTKSVNIFQLIAINTIDQKMQKILNEKQKIINQLIEKDITIEKQSTSITNDLIKIIENDI